MPTTHKCFGAGTGWTVAIESPLPTGATSGGAYHEPAGRGILGSPSSKPLDPLRGFVEDLGDAVRQVAVPGAFGHALADRGEQVDRGALDRRRAAALGVLAEPGQPLHRPLGLLGLLGKGPF